MTSTQQDKELKEEIECVLMHFMELGIAGDPEKELNRASDMLYDLITADRKRVALEARLQEVEVSIIELERSDDPRFYSKDEAIRSQRARYTHLKEELENL